MLPSQQIGECQLSEKTDSKVPKRDLFLAVGVLIFSLALACWLIPDYVAGYTTGTHGLSPRFFPYLIAGTLALLGLILLVTTLRPGVREKMRAEGERPSSITFICIIIFFAYYFAVIFIGLVPASFLALMALMRLSGFRSWVKVLVFSASLVLVLFLFFEKVAQVPAPRGVFFNGWY
jgi:hypothetical protein